MKLYFMQHGLANPENVDPAEGLSKEGFSQTKMAFEGLKFLQIHFDSLICSTKKRAKETAMIIHELFPDAPCIETEDLKAKTSVEAAMHCLSSQGMIDLFIVSHLPLLQELIAFLLPKNSEFSVVNSGVIHVEVPQYEQGKGRLVWQYSPEDLGKMHGES